MQSDQSQGDSATKPNVFEERGGFRVPTGRQIMEFTGGDGEPISTISELMRASSSEKGSQSSICSVGKSGGTEISPPMFITERRKTTTDTNSIPFVGKATGSGQGSTYRKRSRISAEDKTDKKKGQQSFGQTTKVEEHLRQLQTVFDHIVTNGEKTLAIRHTAVEALKNINLEYAVCLSTINNLSNKLLNVQDERNALQQQVVELQGQVLQHSSTGFSKDGMMTTNTYLSAAMRGAASGIYEGKRLPLPSVPASLKHSPAEKIIIFRAKEKGEPVGKKEHENFRQNMKTVLGPVGMQSVEVIRPTRHGGHTVIFSTEEDRNLAMTKLQYYEEGEGVLQKESCMVAPKKQRAKAICRTPPDDITPKEFLQEIYTRLNPQLCSVAVSKREAQIFESKALGWIFELSSDEAAAINVQGGRVRYGGGREVRLEEFIPIQQCYRCCVFGHNAIDCTTQAELCRLCAATDHSGKDCPYKEKKENWKCINCAILNAQKGYNLSTAHAAAQLHKCPCAKHQKTIKKLQLAAAGVFTTPIFGESEIQQLERQFNAKKEQSGIGAQRENPIPKAKKYKSKSRSKSTTKRNTSSSSSRMNTQLGGRNSGPINISQKSNSNGASINLSQISRPVRISRPTSADGWKMAKRGSNGNKSEETRGRDMECRHANINSTDVTELREPTGMIIETQDT